MARVVIQASTSTRQPATRVFHAPGKNNVKVQIFAAGVTVFMADNENDLQKLDQAGNPLNGLQLTNNNGLPYDFLGYHGEMWMASSQQVELEVAFWPL